MPDTNQPADQAVPSTPEALRALLKRTQAGDESTLPVVRKMLCDPANIHLFGGDLAYLAEQSFILELAGKDLGFRVSIGRKLELLREELLGKDPTPVERLLAERAVACWLQVHDADIRYSQSQAKLSIRQIEFHQRRMDAAHRRYLSALKTLALVRKLAVPVLQVNIAKKQLNVASGAITAHSESGLG